MLNEPMIEIEIDEPVGIASLIIEEEESFKEEEAFDINLAETMNEGDLGTVADDLMSLVDTDIASRKDWVEMFVRGLEVLGMKYEERTEDQGR